MRVYHYFFWYPDPDQSFLMRIRIRANDTDPTGSGFETLVTLKMLFFRMKWAAFEENVNNIEEARDILRQLITMYPMLLEARMQQIDVERRQKCCETAEKMYTKVGFFRLLYRFFLFFLYIFFLFVTFFHIFS